MRPDDPEALVWLGNTYAESGDYSKGLEYCLRATRVNPNFAEAYITLSYLYERKDQYQASVNAAKEAARLSPQMAQAYNNISYEYNQLGNPKEALRQCEIALRLSTTVEDTSLSYYNMALSYSKLNQKSKAVDAYRKAIAGFRRWKRLHPDMYYYLGNSYYYLDQVQEAIGAYQEAIKLRPNFAQPHLNLGLAYAVVGDKKAALDEYTILRSIDPKRAEKLFNVIYPKR